MIRRARGQGAGKGDDRAVVALAADHQPAQERGGHVFRMAFDGASGRQKFFDGLRAEQLLKQAEAGGYGGGTAAQSGAQGDFGFDFDIEGRETAARGEMTEGALDEVFALQFDVAKVEVEEVRAGLLALADAQVKEQADSESQSVEAGAEVGNGSGHGNAGSARGEIRLHGSPAFWCPAWWDRPSLFVVCQVLQTVTDDRNRSSVPLDRAS
jgi:hypothetical protein